MQLALIDGRLEEVVELLDREVAWRQEVGLSSYLGQGAFVGLIALQYLGLIQNNPESVVRRAVLEGVNTPEFRRLPMLQGYLGQVDEANQKLERMLKGRPNITTADDMTQVFMDISYLETAVLVKHRQAAELLLRRFANTTVITSIWCIARLLGGAAALLGRYDEARKYYQEAIKVCTEMRFRPELALTRLQLAELLLEHYPAEKKEALEHLDFAIKEFQEMKMRPSLERALRHKEILKA
jgi:tetratricopeptide (TPR) repeat protein